MFDLRTFRNTVIAGVCALSFACASNKPAGDGSGGDGTTSTSTATASLDQKENKDDMICEWEAQIGSNYRKRVCRKKSQVQADREEAQRALGPSKRPSASGGAN